jgi:hypothetical protein
MKRCESCRELRQIQCARGPPVGPARAVAPGTFITGVLHRALGTAADEQHDYNLLFRWSVGLSADDPVWDATVFCKNRDRLLNGDIEARINA